MNYRHAFHAGNFADVVKHIALVAALLHLRRKETPFAVIDTHAGRGLYDLGGEQATRTREAESGIARLKEVDETRASPALRAYLEIVAGAGSGRYPGSPLIAASLLRAQDRLVAIEMHAEENAALKSVLHPFRNARAILADGYQRLPALLPPPERRGVVLIDPPYETEDEFAAAARAVAGALKRFATGIYLVWFPIKSPAEASAFCGEVLTAGATSAVRLDMTIPVEKHERKERLASAGLLVVNPPFGFDAEMAAALDAISPRLDGEGHLTRLAGT
jgi:23S rRNA (adenine2030-N6)-methyltransferase